MTAAFTRIGSGGPLVYDKVGDGSQGYCDAVAIINPADITSSSAGGTPVAGSLVATTSAQSLGSQACRSVLIQNVITNTVDILIGDSSNQTLRLTPGQAVGLDVSNVSLLYVKTVSSTATVAWIAIN